MGISIKNHFRSGRWTAAPRPAPQRKNFLPACGTRLRGWGLEAGPIRLATLLSAYPQDLGPTTFPIIIFLALAGAVARGRATPAVDYWKISKFWHRGRRAAIWVDGRGGWRWVWVGECGGRAKGSFMRLAVWWSCGRWGLGRESHLLGTWKSRNCGWRCGGRAVIWFRFVPLTGWDMRPSAFPLPLLRPLLASIPSNLFSRYQFSPLERVPLHRQTDFSSKANAPRSFSCVPRFPFLFLCVWMGRRLHLDQFFNGSEGVYAVGVLAGHWRPAQRAPVRNY